jgi:hypothetical protein
MQSGPKGDGDHEPAIGSTRNKSSTGGVGSEATRQAHFARRSQFGKTRENCKIVEDEDDPTRVMN